MKRSLLVFIAPSVHRPALTGILRLWYYMKIALDKRAFGKRAFVKELVDEIQDMNRRGFVTAVAVVTAVIVSASVTAEEYDVAVIGGGVADIGCYTCMSPSTGMLLIFR